MRFQFKVNGVSPNGKTLLNKDDAIRAARKVAIESPHETSIVHIEIFDEDGNIVHRDLVLKENLNDMNLSDLHEQGLVDLNTKHEYVFEKKKTRDEPLLSEGDYLMIREELHILTSVTPERAQAQPVRKKQVELVDKFTSKKRSFNTRRRSVPISPYGYALPKEEVEKELIKIKELENSGKIRGNDITVEHDNKCDTGESTESAGHSKNSSGDSTTDRKPKKRDKHI